MINIKFETTKPRLGEPNKVILVTGATGFVGGRLVPCLLEKGYRVRCLVRNTEKLIMKSWYSQVEIVEGDLTSCDTLERSLSGVSTAYYLVHNMSLGKKYVESESAAAQNFADAADSAGIGHIIYLGGLADPLGQIGPHMRSRLQTGEILRQGNVPVTEFRASLIIGSGSVSFEIIRYITEQLPVLIGPRWANFLCQPISIRNILDYLLSAVEMPACKGNIYEIGGTDQLMYSETMQIYAELRGLYRPFWIFPFVPISFMAYMIDKITPINFNLANPLLNGMQSDSLMKDQSALIDFPHIQRESYRESVCAALGNLSPEKIGRVLPTDESRVNIRKEGFFVDARCVRVDASTDVVFATILSLGGNSGWLYMNWLWKLRGWIDRRIGGPGMRGRRSPSELQMGDLVDFYLVDELIPGCKLRLKAELVAPGDGWMDWQVEAALSGGTALYQTAFFAPKGVWGYCYWYFFYPFHQLIFTGLAKAIRRKAEASHSKYLKDRKPEGG